MPGEICKICKHPKLLNIENMLLEGTLGVEAIARVLEQETVFVEPEDLKWHLEHCMLKALNTSGAHKTLQQIQKCGTAIQKAQSAYSLLDNEYSATPPGTSAIELLKRRNTAYNAYVDMREEAKVLQTRYDLQVKQLDAKKLLKTRMADINKAAARTTEIEAGVVVNG